MNSTILKVCPTFGSDELYRTDFSAIVKQSISIIQFFLRECLHHTECGFLKLDFSKDFLDPQNHY